MGRVIEDRYFARRLTVPAGVPAAFPIAISFPVDPLILVRCELVIPDGHVGVTGFAIEFAGRRIVPWGSEDDWIQGNADELAFNVNFEVGTEIVFMLYNQGAYDHSFYARLQMRYLPDVPADTSPALALVI